MRPLPDFLAAEHDPRDPSPWLALYLDRSTPLPDVVKTAWLKDCSSRSRQFVLPLLRPLARAFIVLFQLFKILLPRSFNRPYLLHRLLVWGLKTWVSPEANLLILRHFHAGSTILKFIGDNSGVGPIDTVPLRPKTLDDLKDLAFLQHDLNLYNFIIELNRRLDAQGRTLAKPETLDFSMVGDDDEFPIEAMPNRWSNFLDLQSAIELFTPIYQLFMTDNDFWRATNSLQLDETIGIYAATLMGMPERLVLINNKHPLVLMSTLRAGYRLVLHGLATEMLHGVLVASKQRRPAFADR